MSNVFLFFVHINVYIINYYYYQVFRLVWKQILVNNTNYNITKKKLSARAVNIICTMTGSVFSVATIKSNLGKLLFRLPLLLLSSTPPPEEQLVLRVAH